MKNGLSRSEQRTVSKTQKQPLDRKSPIQVSCEPDFLDQGADGAAVRHRAAEARAGTFGVADDVGCRPAGRSRPAITCKVVVLPAPVSIVGKNGESVNMKSSGDIDSSLCRLGGFDNEDAYIDRHLRLAAAQPLIHGRINSLKVGDGLDSLFGAPEQ